jgi:hypothetical protein
LPYPRGARAIDLGNTVYRIHGTNIAVASGPVRLGAPVSYGRQSPDIY